MAKGEWALTVNCTRELTSCVSCVGRNRGYLKKKYNDKHNPINNPIYNPIHNQKRKDANRAEAVEAEKRKHGKEKVLTTERVNEISKEILASTPPAFGGMTVEDFVMKFGGYIGLTRCAEVRNESLRWLTARGSTPYRGGKKMVQENINRPVNRPVNRRRNRPVLISADGEFITMRTARSELDFSEIVVYGYGSKYGDCQIKLNCSLIEDALQHHFQNELKLPLGVRLWRHIAKGATRGDETKMNQYSYKCFITFSTKYIAMLQKQEILLNGIEYELERFKEYFEEDDDEEMEE